MYSGVPGAVTVRNEKGQASIEKVKVSRYVSGKRPDYALKSSSEDESEEEEFGSHQRFRHDDKHDDDKKEDEEEEYYEREELMEHERLDPRLRRLMTVESGSRSEDSDDDYRARHYESEVESEEEELDAQEMERRRAWLRQRALEKRDEELLAKDKEDKESDSQEESESSEYEEYTDCEEEARPRLKPVFVRKEERVTVKDKDNEETAYKQQEEQSHSKLERRKETLKLLEEEICKERRKGGSDDDEDESNATMPKISDVNTDEENEEAEYAAWKLRELKRLKRARDEREAFKREQEEIQRLRNMTDEERRLELKLNPKVIVNQASKGKYKFMQKYYHRGVFFMDKEDKVFMKDFSQPTLEDKFDKTTLPKIMQVKKFGKRGCTKYTHLTDQDTTNFDSAWGSETAVNMKFHTDQAAGVRPVFQKPTLKRSKTDSKK